MNISKIVVTALSMLVSGSLGAIELKADLKLMAGLDSNPLRLADDKPITQDQYWRIDSSLGISLFDKLDLSIDASTRQFMDDDRANQLDVDARLRFKNKFRAFGERFYYRFGYEQTQHDETYVSRRTGDGVS
jgi:hypothetical protein